MTVQELVKEATQLSPADRLVLMDALYHSLRDDVEPGLPLRKGGLALLLGIGKTDEPAPTDEEISEEYTNYLMEKYH
jgi:hypothetical protein